MAGWQPAIARWVNVYAQGQKKESSQQVWNRCRANRGAYIPLPNGGRSTEVDVLAEILETAGVNPTDSARIQSYTGKFIIRGQGNGNIFTTIKTAPTETAVRKYNETKEEYAERHLGISGRRAKRA